jgi:HSP20 family molecular chaperone IbpA
VDAAGIKPDDIQVRAYACSHPCLHARPGASVPTSRASLPTSRPTDPQVTLDRGTLRIKGESKGSKDGVEWHRRVEKSVQLPEMAIDADKVEAINEHGMLHVTVPKLRIQQPTPRSIPVTVKSQK